MADGKDPFFYHMFFAVPEIMFEDIVLKYLRKENYITDEALDAIQRIKRDKGRIERIYRRTKKYSTLSRILAIAPEVMSAEFAELLHRTKLIDNKDYKLIRAGIGIVGAIRGGEDRRDIAIRTVRVLGVASFDESLRILREAGFINARQEREMITFGNSAGRLFESSATKALKVKSLVDLLLLGGSSMISPDALRLLKISGVINARTMNALIEAAKYGSAMWTVFEGSKKADGLAARMAYVVSGSFSWEAIRVLQALGVVDKRQEYLLKVAVFLSQTYNRRLMEQMTQRRFRILPGETPLQTFARQSKGTNKELLRLLSAASKESARDAKAMKGLSSAQRAVRVASLHRSMRALWEGVGHITIFGEAQAAEAGVEAMANLQKAFRSKLPREVVLMMDMQAKSSLDAYISRKENAIQLSKRVYGNINLFTGKVDKRINIHLLKGSSAEEIAKDIARFISPTTPGGVSYAAMRLGRTELANAFHTTTIRHGREMPWVQGWKWNLSGSHGRPDICNQYAEDDHDNMGAGVFKKRNVPGKPHPQCLCFLTAVQPTEDQFVSNMKRGFYNQYLTAAMGSQDAGYTVGEEKKKRAYAAMQSIVLPVAVSAYQNRA